MAAIDYKKKADQVCPVIIDHLAFTFPIRDLKHLVGHVGYGDLKIPEYPERINGIAPDFYTVLVKRYEATVIDYLEFLFKRFVYRELGMELSRPRGRGLHGYTDSFILLDKSGEHELGFVGFGGNNETVFIQINGLGCKYLFDFTKPKKLHKVLAGIIGITNISRLDLAVDDFTGNFGFKYAKTAFFDGAFRTSKKGNYPKLSPVHSFDINGNENITGINVGSRTSRVFWRIYDKRQEQKIVDTDVIWFRNEVELKKVSIDMLYSPAAAFAGLCDFAASMEPSDGRRFDTIKRKSVLEMKGKVSWARKQVGRTLAQITDFYDGDLDRVFGLLIPVKHRESGIDLPDTNKALSQIFLGV